jgi:protein phosphatase
MQIRYHAETKQFDRDNNEDFFFADEKNGLYIVADGMGGAAGGEVASKFVPLLAGRIIKNLGAVVARGDEDSILYDEKVFCYDHQNALRHAYLETHDQLRVMGLKNVDLMNMGCAIVMLFFRNERVYIMNGGDCRCYLLGDRKLRQITRDHSFMEHLIRSGELTEEEARRHPKRGRLTRWVGGD